MPIVTVTRDMLAALRNWERRRDRELADGTRKVAYRWATRVDENTGAVHVLGGEWGGPRAKQFNPNARDKNGNRKKKPRPSRRPKGTLALAQGRSLFQLSPAEVAEVRDALSRSVESSVRITHAIAQSLATQYLAGALTRPTDTTAAQRKRAQRERARAAGRCIVNPAHAAAEGRATCDACNAAARARQDAISGKTADVAPVEPWPEWGTENAAF